MGQRVTPKGDLEVWMRVVLPEVNGYRSCAAVVFNKAVSFHPTVFTMKLADYPDYIKPNNTYTVMDLYTKYNYGNFSSDDTLQLSVNPSGGVVMLKFTIV